MITIGKCLEWMHSGKPFSLTAVSYDERRPAKCGRVLVYPEAVLVWGNGGSDRTNGTAAERPMTALEAKLSMPAASDKASAGKRNPGHSEWYTRNIRELQDGAPTAIIRKIHPPLIIEFNGETTCP